MYNETRMKWSQQQLISGQKILLRSVCFKELKINFKCLENIYTICPRPRKSVAGGAAIHYGGAVLVGDH